MKTIGQFDCKVIKAGKTDGPFNPIVRIVLGRSSIDQSGERCVSPDLMTVGEIDAHVAALKADLDAVGARAKRELEKANSELGARFKGRASS